jgi:hypothetical protein
MALVGLSEGMNNHMMSLTILHLAFDQGIQASRLTIDMVIVLNEPLAPFTIIRTKHNNTS